ncbi:MAG: TrbI/VirB10 family protein [Sphingorhabdus sp.]
MKKAGKSKLNEPLAGEKTVAPTVSLPKPGLSGVAIFIGALVLGLILFNVLDTRRKAASAPSVIVPEMSNSQFSVAPPPLEIPAEFSRSDRLQSTARETPNIAPPVPALSYSSPPVQYIPSPQPEPPIGPNNQIPATRTSSGSALVLDNSAPLPTRTSEAEPSKAAGPSGNTDRVRAAIIANRSTTVPQGTLIKAVLETALNSTNPGFARAVVSRNIYGFDGSRVLIPRGSRLVGEYQAEVSPGQNRALINWTRLIRPDGVTIAIGSPATGPLGRGGVRAKVDTHFFERFSAAIFQSALDIGVNVASRQVDGAVIIAPAAQGATISQTNRITPTLKVKPGASISVFVARDLDFTDVEIVR